MPGDDLPDPAERYHEIAASLMLLAQRARSADTRRRLIEMAALFERRAERAEQAQDIED